MRWAERRREIKGFAITRPPENFLRSLQRRDRVSTLPNARDLLTEFRESPADARDAHEAAGLWWAQAIHDVAARDYEASIGTPVEGYKSLFLDTRVVPRLGDFAHTLSRMSRSRGLSEIRTPLLTGHLSENILLEAAKETLLPTKLFPADSYTVIDAKGVLKAKSGREGGENKIWPPVAA